MTYQEINMIRVITSVLFFAILAPLSAVAQLHDASARLAALDPNRN
jgi:hypothetical protein